MTIRTSIRAGAPPLLGLVMAALAACGSTSATLAPQTIPAPNLTFAGPIAGSMTSATRATCATSSSASGVGGLTVTIEGPVSGQPVVVAVRLDTFIGSGTYAAQTVGPVTNGVSVSGSAISDTVDTQQAETTGDLGIDKGIRSGTLDVTVGTEKVKGRWRC